MIIVRRRVIRRQPVIINQVPQATKSKFSASDAVVLFMLVALILGAVLI